MSRFTILIRIAAIIFCVEGLIMIGFSFFEPVGSTFVSAIIDATLLTILASPLINYFVIKPYMEERVDFLFGVQNILSDKDDE
jgi:Cu/Ag efflux pump CusA